jgi:excisionase family DNA binding protein
MREPRFTLAELFQALEQRVTALEIAVQQLREPLAPPVNSPARATAVNPKGMPLAPKLLYTRPESAARLSLSLATIQELLNQGKLRGVRKGHRVLIHIKELERFAAEDTETIWEPKRPIPPKEC